MDQAKITIAVDGFSSCGKSTLAKGLAKAMGYLFIDSGAMYRGVTLFALRKGLVSIESDRLDTEAIINSLPSIQLEFRPVEDEETAHLFLNGEDVERDIRKRDVSSRVSYIARIKEVREYLVKQQQQLGSNGGIVMDGRDIGSVVFPNAELKLFVTADINVRTQRRYKELQEKGIQMSMDEVRDNLTERDYIDSTRKESPLIQVADALVLDNSTITREEQLELVLNWCQEKINSLSSRKNVI